jgi:hypothetical protein
VERIARVLALVVAVGGSTAVVAHPLRAQQPAESGVPLTGFVADQFGQPVVNAQVRLVDDPGGAVAHTAAAGAYRLEGVRPGKHRIRVRRAGYLASTGEVALRAGDTQVRDWELRRLPANVDPRIVQGEDGELRAGLQAFQRRRLTETSGTFIDRETIDRRRPRYASELLRGVSGFRLASREGSDPTLWSTAAGNGPGCRTPMYLEGLPYSPITGIDDFAPEDIEAIEVYPAGAAVAAQVNAGDAACGALLIWLRR